MQQDDTHEILATIKAAAMNPLAVLMTTPLLTRLMAFIALICLAIIVIVAILRRMNNSPRSGLLVALGWVALLSSLAGTAYEGLMIYVGVQATHTTHLAVIMPGLIEGCEVLLIGIIAWIVAGMGNAGARRS